MYVHPKMSNEEVEKIFENTEFTTTENRKLLAQGVLQVAAGYKTGNALFRVMVDLGLISDQWRVIKKGRRFLYTSFCDDNYNMYLSIYGEMKGG